MTLQEYEQITGITVPTSQQAFVTAQIARTQRILEQMLGYTLTLADAHENQYVETGISPVECPCSPPSGALNPPDPVTTAYRLFPYNKKDKFLLIDPATVINAVKLVSGSITYRVLETDEYAPYSQHGFIKALQQVDCFCTCTPDCSNVQLAVDADWLWFTGDTLPADLLDVFAEMVTFYSDPKNGIQSETLGPHTYRKFERQVPQEISMNLSILRKYAGPMGSLQRVVTA